MSKELNNQEINNSISWIKFDKTPIEKGNYIYAVMIQMKDKNPPKT
jgi:hypothetical protein